MTRSDLPLRGLRTGITALVAVDLVALAALSVRVTSTTEIRTVRPLAGVGISAAAPTVTPVPSAQTPVPGPVALPDLFPVPFAAPALPRVAASSTVPGVTSTATPVSATPPTPSTSPTTEPAVPSALQACPLPLAEPAQAGGLQSLIDFAPAFGPLSSEAFAAASSYQPALQLIGPILAQYPKLAPKLAPALDPLLKAWDPVLSTLFGLIEPYYAPHREQVLEAETKLAAILAPYAQRLANSAVGACVVDLQAALIADTM